MLRLLLRGGEQIFAYVMGVCFNRNESRVQSYREHSSLVNGSGGSISPIIENDSGTSRSLILSYMESSGLDN